MKVKADAVNSEFDFSEEKITEKFIETLREEKTFYPNNHEKFSSIVYKPEAIRVSGRKYTIYQVRFNSLYSVYDFLKEDPEINRVVFKEVSSLSDNYSFYGKPYNEALEDLVSDDDPEYQEFLKIQKQLERAHSGPIHKYKTVRTVAGGHLNIPAYCAGDPLCYETEERVISSKFIRFHVTLSYRAGTSKKQVLYRAIIITNILKALEDAGYKVDLNTFELSFEADELIYIVVQIKRFSEKLNMSSLHKVLCHVEFLRRILFRILEITDVKNDWEDGYGVTCSEEFVRKVLELDKDDYYFGTPDEMGIKGESLTEDFISTVNYLKIGDKINLEKAKKEFEKCSKLLKIK